MVMEWLNSGRASSIIGPNFQRLNDWPEFAETVKLIKSNAAGWPTKLDLACRWYAPHLERRYEDARIREADLLQLVQIASTHPNRQRFLTDLTLDPPAGNQR
jgi:DNA helicase-2/ATP-dependent DNA helicase PcrA